MITPETCRQKFDELKACVIIPTYNNAVTLAGVINDVLLYTSHIIIVNDGSSDQTSEILDLFPGLNRVEYKKNRGKGWAIRQGFARALSLGYQYALTIDSDGQHFAKDLPVFIEAAESKPDTLFVGARNMNQPGIPGKSSFGNRFSNFWFKIETGIKLPDTQSGYRLYPISLMKGNRYFTKKYEFEIEVLVRAAWQGIKIEPLPVSVYYPKKEERISHFRPFRDFTRISILNTILVLIAFFFIKPRKFFRTLFNRQKAKEFLLVNFIEANQLDSVKAFSIGFGIFMGIIPIWGFQLVAAIFLAFVFRLNKALVIIAANISIPPMIPLIIYGSYKMGGYWMGSQRTNIEFNSNISLESVRNHFTQYIYGSITLAIFMGILLGTITYLLLKILKRRPVSLSRAS
ncbi:MAG: DUF2062 domain-containing protein [Bacteroidetes bacterium]|nr:MAG: DUF2062 domain-containing protein [Bacteroidota bacterium]